MPRKSVTVRYKGVYLNNVYNVKYKIREMVLNYTWFVIVMRDR